MMSTERGIVTVLLIATLTAWGCQGEPRPEEAPPGGQAGGQTGGQAGEEPAPGAEPGGEAPGGHPELSLSAEGRALVSQDGTELPIVDGAVNGSLDHWESDGETAKLSGWAAAVERSLPADLVVIARNGEVVASTPADLHRQDVAEHFGDEALAVSGFEIAFPAEEDMEVTVYGVAEGVASKLPATEGYPWTGDE
ncbi:MAG: hypothetical protein ACOC92_00230 [bacterium]